MKTLTLRLIPKNNLLKKLAFLNQETKLGFKIKDINSTSREKENLISPQKKTRDKLSDIQVQGTEGT
jgi:hypothetical protein